MKSLVKMGIFYCHASLPECFTESLGFFAQNFPLSFWTTLLFSVSSKSASKSVLSFLEPNFHKMKPPKSVQSWKFKTLEFWVWSISVFFWFLQVVSTTTWSSKRKVESSLKMIGHLLLSKKPQQIPPSTTPAAHGAARRPTARRSLHHRPKDWHRRQQLFVTSVRVTGPVQLMKEIRGSPVDVGRVLGFRVVYHTIFTQAFYTFRKGLEDFWKKSTVCFRGT